MMLSAEGRVDLSETVKAACKQAYQGICHPVTELQGLSQRALKRQVRHPAASRVRVGDELALAHRGSPWGLVCPETSGYVWIKFTGSRQSDLGLLCNLKSIFNFDAEVSHRAFELGMSKEQLHGT